MKVLITAPIEFLPFKLGLIEKKEVVYAYQATREEILNLKKKIIFSGWVCSPCPTYSIDNEMLRSFTNLKIIATPSTDQTI